MPDHPDLPAAPSTPAVRVGAVDVRVEGEIAVVTIDRPHKRNAIDDGTVLALEQVFGRPPEGVRAWVLQGAGDHFCAGLDLSALSATSVAEGIEHSRTWHRITTAVQLGPLPVVSVLKGAVIGGGLELASATHLRVAEPSAFYSLPEGQRGIFVGGGGSVRLPRLIGLSRMTDLMLTGRVYDAAEGHAAGISHYLVGAGEGLERARELARRAASVAPLTAFGVLQVLPRTAEGDQQQGYLLESLMAAVAQGSEEAKARMAAFLAGRTAKVTEYAAGPPASTPSPQEP